MEKASPKRRKKKLNRNTPADHEKRENIQWIQIKIRLNRQTVKNFKVIKREREKEKRNNQFQMEWTVTDWMEHYAI